MKISKKIISFLKNIIKIVLFLIVIYNTIYVFGKHYNKTFNVKLFGIQTLLNEEKTMEPAINKNDVVIVNKKADIEQGDIIAFYKNEKLLLRRVSGVKNIDNEKEYITKGDNSLYSDKDTIKNSQVEGKVVTKLRHIGLLHKLIRSKVLTIINTFIMGLIIIITNKREKNDIRRRKLKEEYNK